MLGHQFAILKLSDMSQVTMGVGPKTVTQQITLEKTISSRLRHLPNLLIDRTSSHDANRRTLRVTSRLSRKFSGRLKLIFPPSLKNQCFLFRTDVGVWLYRSRDEKRCWLVCQFYALKPFFRLCTRSFDWLWLSTSSTVVRGKSFWTQTRSSCWQQSIT